MRYLKKFEGYRIVENLKSKIDLNELDTILVDFKQMGLDYELRFDPDIIINWDKVDAANGLYYLSKYDLDIKDNIGRLAWSKGIASNSLKIEFYPNQYSNGEYNFKEVSETYEMLKNYLFEYYDLITNYVYCDDNPIGVDWLPNEIYFQNFDKIEETKIYANTLFKTNTLILAFYKKPNGITAYN